jgi:hypothetical protein
MAIEQAFPTESDPCAPNATEREVLARATEGAWAEFLHESDGRLRLRAKFLRQLLLSMPVTGNSCGTAQQALAAGIRVRGAHIEGKLDLTDCAGAGGMPLPPLLLEACDIPEPVDLSYARLMRFSVADSRITYVCARGTRLEGTFDFSRVRAYDSSTGGDEEKIAWIDAHGACIAGDVEGRGAQLRAPSPRPASDVPPRRERYALRLSTADVRGRVLLTADFEAIGGIILSDSDFRGEVVLTGATVSAGEGAALSGQRTRFGSVLFLDRGFTARGEVWLWGAKITGDLQCTNAVFENSKPDGAGLALVGANAEFCGDVIFQGVRGLGQIDLTNANIGGDLNCFDATFENPKEDGTGGAFAAARVEIGGNVFLGGPKFKASGSVTLMGAKIGGSLHCDDATFENRTAEGTGYALEVGSAGIRTDFTLRRVKTAGLVSLIGAKIGGDLDCEDGSFDNRTEDGKGFCLGFERAEIDGIVFLRGTQVKALGQVNLAGAKIGGDLDCAGATFENRTGDGTGAALSATGAEIGNDFIMNGAKASGRVGLVGAKIGGDLDCSDANFENWTEDGTGAALIAERVKIGGAAFLSGAKFTALGQVDLMGAEIGGTLVCEDATFENRTENGTGYALLADNLSIDGDVLLRGARFKASGRVGLTAASIGGTLDCERATFANRTPSGHANTLVADNTEIGTDLSFRRAVSIGGISLSGGRIGRDFDVRGARLLSPRSYAISAINLRVAGRVSLGPSIVLGDLSLQHMDVVGGLDWSRLFLPREYTYDGELYQTRAGRSHFSLANSHIGTELKAERLTSVVPLEIDLGGAHVATLCDRWPAGWSADSMSTRRVSLNLDGFVYDRIAHLPAEEASARLVVQVGAWAEHFAEWTVMEATRIRSAVMDPGGWLSRTAEQAPRLAMALRRCGGPVRTAISPLAIFAAWLWRQAVLALGQVFRRGIDWARRVVLRPHYSAETRLQWLALQRGGFFPQPYRHLARVLRAQGHERAARQVGIAEGWKATAGFWHRLLRPLFGYGFGFGLSPGRASFTLVLFVVVGWLGTDRALREGAMVLTAAPVAAVVVPDGGIPRAAIQKGQTALASIEARCTDQIAPLFYSIDLMLPVIPLHQETKCEVSVRPEFFGWQMAKLVFSILGKIVTALALITFSGVLKARLEE